MKTPLPSTKNNFPCVPPTHNVLLSFQEHDHKGVGKFIWNIRCSERTEVIIKFWSDETVAIVCWSNDDTSNPWICLSCNGIKENFDSSIIDKILNTNQKVDVIYQDFNNKEQTKTSDISPKLKLTEPPTTLPKAGITTFIVTGSIVAISILIFSTAKLLIINRKMK